MNTATKQECYEYLHTALCNAVGTGYMLGYGLSLHDDADKYREAEGDTWEDKLIAQLKAGGWLKFFDIEGGTMHSETITDDNLQERFNKYVDEADVLEMKHGLDDAVTADNILQCLFYGEVLFG